jgi:hypothetical protein
MIKSEKWFAISMITFFLLFLTAEYVVWEVVWPRRDCSEKGPEHPVTLRKQADPQGQAAASRVIEIHDWPCFYRGHASPVTKETDSIQEPHELAERLAFQPAESPYRLIPRSASIWSEESGLRRVPLSVPSVSDDSPPRGRIILTVLRWGTYTTKVDGKPVTVTVHYDVVPGGNPSAR